MSQILIHIIGIRIAGYQPWIHHSRTAVNHPGSCGSLWAPREPLLAYTRQEIAFLASSFFLDGSGLALPALVHVFCRISKFGSFSWSTWLWSWSKLSWTYSAICSFPRNSIIRQWFNPVMARTSRLLWAWTCLGRLTLGHCQWPLFQVLELSDQTCPPTSLCMRQCRILAIPSRVLILLVLKSVDRSLELQKKRKKCLTVYSTPDFDWAPLTNWIWI